MSLLDKIKQRRKSLKPTETVITTTDGKRFLKQSVSNDVDLVPLEETTLGFVVDNTPDPIPSCIVEDFLYLGSQDACNEESLQKFNITHVLSVGIEMPPIQSPLNIRNVHVPCLDIEETNLNDQILENSFRFIQECRDMGGRILIHCNAGVSRSASVTIAYLMQYQGMSFEIAFKYVKEKRPCIQPNAGFKRQLKQFELSQV